MNSIFNQLSFLQQHIQSLTSRVNTLEELVKTSDRVVGPPMPHPVQMSEEVVTRRDVERMIAEAQLGGNTVSFSDDVILSPLEPSPLEPSSEPTCSDFTVFEAEKKKTKKKKSQV